MVEVFLAALAEATGLATAVVVDWAVENPLGVRAEPVGGRPTLGWDENLLWSGQGDARHCQHDGEKSAGVHVDCGCF